MNKVLNILKPLLWIALIVGTARFILSVSHAPRTIVYLASLTAVELIGMLYLAFRMGGERELGYLNLWTANLILFGLCQLLYIAGLVYTYFTGTPTLYHETERLGKFLQYEPTIPQHIGMHVLNWMIIAPTIATWVIGAPIVNFRRRRINRIVAS